VRKALSLIVLVILVGLIVSNVGILRDPKTFPPDDFVEYWAAGRLNLQGQNPYNGDLLTPLEKEAGRTTDLPVMMWNPPWTLTFVMPFGAIPPHDSKLVWFFQNFALVLVSVAWLWKLYGGRREQTWIALLLGLTFLPTLNVLNAGQIGPLILFGVTLFLAMEKAGYPWLAGAAGVLMAIKPHLVYLFWPALALSSFFRGWKIVAGGVATGLVATGIPMLFNPGVLGDFWREITQRPPDYIASPTLGTVIRWIEARVRGGGEKSLFLLQFVPAAIGLGWLLWCGWSTRRQPWDWRARMPMILLVSFVTASYGAWPFDLVILLPAVIDIAARAARSPDRGARKLAIGCWIAFNCLALGQNMIFKAYSFYFLWMAPLLLVLYVLLDRKLRASSTERTEPTP
jgi:hypothetical protein